MTDKKVKLNGGLRVAAMLLAILFLLSAVSLAGCASSKNENRLGAKVEKKGERITVKATVSSEKRDVYLFSIGIWQSPEDISKLEPIKKAKVSNRQAKASVDVEGNLDEMLCRGYVFGMISEDGKSYEPVSDVNYVTNPRDAHKGNKLPEESDVSGALKGLIGTPSGLVELGAKKTVVTVDFGKLLCGKGGKDAVSFVFDGISCHIDRNMLAELDAEIKAYSSVGVKICLEVIQTVAYNELDSEIKCISFEGAAGAEGYALNMTNREGATKISGALAFLAERYSGGENGSIEAFIIGRNVNNFSVNYAGGPVGEQAIRNYVAVVRVAYNLIVGSNPRGRAYVAIGNNWGFAEEGDVSASEMLTTFTNLAENGGDFFWQLCIEANSSDRFNSAIWEDSLAGSNPRFISPVNIDVVTDVLAAPAYLCVGEQRNVLLNRFSIGGEKEDEQAASYAYAYYKCLDNGKIDGIIYAKTVDDISDTIKDGLYSADGVVLDTPKKLGTIFRNVDNDTIGDIAYISGLLGEQWNVLYNINKKSAVSWSVTRGQSTDDRGREELSVLADFSEGDMNGFTPISANYAELRYSSSWEKSVLYVALSPEIVGDGSGVATKEIRLENLKKAGFITCTAMITTAEGNAGINVRLSGYDKDGKERVFCAHGTIRSGEWVELYYNIEEFIKEIDSETLTLMVTAKGTEAESDVKELWIARITAQTPTEKPFPWWIIWVILALVAAGGLTVFVIWFRKNYTFVRE